MNRGPLRIAFVTGSLEPGGSERQMIALARHLPRERFAVEFLLLTHRGARAEEAEALGVPVYCVDIGRRTASYPRLALRLAAGMGRYVRHVRRHRFEILDAWLYHGYVVAASTRPLTGAPVVLSGRRSLSDFKASFGPIEMALGRIAARGSDLIVANSEYVRSDVVRREGLDPDRIRVIHNGVEQADPISASERHALRAAWGAASDTLVVGCVANYHPRKGHLQLVEAAAALRDSLPSALFVLVGEGPGRADLEALIRTKELAGRVVLHGTARDARRLYGAFDLVVQASESEGLPNAMLEAGAAGVAVVATDAGGTREVVVDGSTGLLVPVDDIDRLAVAVRRLAEDPALRVQLGSAAREHVLQRFAMSAFVRAYGDVYEEMAARKLRR